MDSFFAALFHVTLFILIYGLIGRTLRDRFFLSVPMLCVFYGLLIGPSFLNFLNTRYTTSKEVLFYLSKTLLCMQTMAAAMSLPHGYILKQKMSIIGLVAIVGIAKYMVTACVTYFFSKYNFLVSLAIAACLTPTDPVLTSSIINSKFANTYVPERLRNLIQAESGINDGFGLLLLYIPIDFMFGSNVEDSVLNLFFSTVVYKGIFAGLIGLVFGYIARKALHKCHSKDMVDGETFLVYGLTLTFFILGLMELLKMSELVGIFFAGTGFSWDEWFVFETRECKLQEIVDNLCTCTFFILFGSRIELSFLSYGLFVFSIMIICFRRLLICIFLKGIVPEVMSAREAVFVGWLGPIGVGALYYSLYFDAVAKTLTYNSVSIVVMFSVIIHGIVMIILRICFSGKKYLKEWGIPFSDVCSESFVSTEW
ncbi:hypothetical protein EDEG_01174 [Edhazardia aedis USNM 41457]|uniref:Cation/H+ exchanger transmembrane domain-containing protein n=1 Tax=Edhazardia aedis (strain USNM 41457) TaxID=1003232 RepID=J9DTL8_EDHAE|nr:hypothetical protein EDEG_01174 [Edhazardia aedis USNM 41457]|eukprot:EJW04622.1 hypothetical protein EDEG_01174 [Edhazardia aedis USNM 41457]